MKSYKNWLIERNLVEKPPIKKDGSVDVDQKIAKKADLIVLPPSVEGTNCGNCKYYEKKGGEGFCVNSDIKQWVTPRMCCAYWDRDDVHRSWGSMSV